MFTANGQRFATVEIARLVVVDGWTHVPATVDGQGGCTWIVERHGWYDGDADGAPEPYTVREDCGAELAYTDDRWRCAAGHEHISAEARDREGWDYAADAYDAAVITAGAREYRPMGPTTFIDPAEVEHVLRTLVLR